MIKTDLIRDAAQKGEFVIWEEAARDGAQAKTLIPARARVEFANMMGEMFNGTGQSHVIFCAGFPAIHKEEYNATRLVALEVGSVSTTCLCRSVPSDIKLAVQAMSGSAHGRIFMFIPVSEATARALLHRPAIDGLAKGLEALDYALQLADCMPVDVALVDVANADFGLLREAANRVHEKGASTVMLADTTGQMFPHEVFYLFHRMKEQTSSEVVFASHLHNDYGFGLINTLQAARAGSFIGASSFLGLGERAGMPHTEELVFHFAHCQDQLRSMGIHGKLWEHSLKLELLPRIARFVSDLANIPILTNKPIVGGGVHSISTETPFKDRDAFRPFDPMILGLKDEVALTHLAHRKVVQAIAEELGIEIPHDMVNKIIDWVKTTAYKNESAEVPKEYLSAYLKYTLKLKSN